MTLDLLEPERQVVTQDILWRKYYIEQTRLEQFRIERDAVHRTIDAIPHGMRPEYFRMRRERLKKHLE